MLLVGAKVQLGSCARRGVRMVLHRFGTEEKFILLGKGNQLYSLGLVPDAETPQEILLNDEAWKVEAGSSEDIGAVQILGTKEEAWVGLVRQKD